MKKKKKDYKQETTKLKTLGWTFQTVLVRSSLSSPDRAVRVRVLPETLLCCVLGQDTLLGFTLTVRLSEARSCSNGQFIGDVTRSRIKVTHDSRHAFDFPEPACLLVSTKTWALGSGNDSGISRDFPWFYLRPQWSNNIVMRSIL